jgi:hypothetical protein
LLTERRCTRAHGYERGVGKYHDEEGGDVGDEGRRACANAQRGATAAGRPADAARQRAARAERQREHRALGPRERREAERGACERPLARHPRQHAARDEQSEHRLRERSARELDEPRVHRGERDRDERRAVAAEPPCQAMDG